MNFQPSFGRIKDKNAGNEQSNSTKYQIYKMYGNFMPCKQPPEYAYKVIDYSYDYTAVYHGQHFRRLIYAVKKRHAETPFALPEKL